MTKYTPKRTFRKKNKMYIPKTLYCPYCGGKAILRPVSYLFGDEVNPGSSEHYYVCNNYPECDAHIRFSTNYSIEKSIAILREILDNNGIEYDKEEIESSGFIKQRSETVNRQLCV